MITEDYVSFETAKLLKEKGFDDSFVPVNYGFNTYDEITGTLIMNNPSGTILTPTLQMAMKWLREVHHVYMYAAHDGMLDKWFARVYGDVKHIKDLDWHKSYEEACEEAIRYCLQNLI